MTAGPIPRMMVAQSTARGRVPMSTPYEVVFALVTMLSVALALYMARS